MSEKRYMLLPVEIKLIDDQNVDPDNYIVTGLTSTYNNIDLGGDMVMPGFFTEDLVRNGNVRPALWQHMYNQPVGTKEFTDSSQGLQFKAKLPRDDTFVSGRVIPQIRAGAIQGASMGYSLDDFEKDGNVWKLIKGCLYESSFVTFPMNPKAVIFSVSKHLQMITEGKIKSAGNEQSYLQQFAKSVGIESFELKKYVSGFEKKERNMPLADQATKWEKSVAIQRVKEATGSVDNPAKNYEIGFLYYDQDKKDNYESYKLPYVDYIDGKFRIIPKALSEIVGALSGDNSGVKIDERIRHIIKDKINGYYKQMGREEPFKNNITFIDSFDIEHMKKQDKVKIFDDNVMLSTSAKKYIADLLCSPDKGGTVDKKSSKLLEEVRKLKTAMEVHN